jgi:hypothetical protein
LPVTIGLVLSVRALISTIPSPSHPPPQLAPPATATPPEPAVEIPVLARAFFDDDFSNEQTGWGIESTSDYSFGYLRGEYRIQVKRPGQHRYWVRWTNHRFPAVSVEVDARLRSGGRSGVGLDVVCVVHGNPIDAYVFLIEPEASTYEILKISGGEAPLLLLSGPGEAILKGPATNRIQGECAGQPNGSAALLFRVNGDVVGLELDPNGFDGFIGIGMFASALLEDVDARFDNLLMKA